MGGRSLSLLSVLLSFVFVSCGTLGGPRGEILVWDTPSPGTRYSLGEIRLTAEPLWVDMKAVAGDLAEMAARKVGVPLAPPGQQGAALTLDLAEEVCGTGLDPLRSVVAILKIWKDRPGSWLAGQVVFTEMTRKSLRSAPYLKDIITELFQTLGTRAEFR